MDMKRPLKVRSEPQAKKPAPEPELEPEWSGLQWMDADLAESGKENEEQSTQGPSSKQKSAKTINKLRSKVRRLVVKQEKLKKQPQPVKPNIKSILEATSTILPKSIQSFMGLQLKLASVPPKGRRYTDDELAQAIAIYYQGPRAYYELRKRFFLPSPRALRRRLELVQLNPGMHPMVMALLKEKCRGAEPHEQQVVISFDEMQVRPKLTYLPGRDCFEGFEDLGELGRTERPADHALVFMVRGLTSKWKQPIGYFLSCGPTPARVILPLLKSAVQQVRQAGFVVAGTVCDMGTPNQDLYRRLGVTADRPCFMVDDASVPALHDVPHLIKCVRNGLLKHDVVVDGETLSWRHLLNFYQEDKDRPIRTAPKLTKTHLQPDAFKKMKVKLATQMLSRSTAAGMLLYASLGILPADVIPTARAMDRLNNLFDVLNSSTPHSPNPLKRALSVQNEAQLLPLLRDARDWISRWKVGDGVKVDFVHGLMLTITAVVNIWTSLKDGQLAFLMTRRLNQDGLENLFGVVRMCHGPNDRPDPTQFRHAYRKSTASRILCAPVTANCEADGDALLGVLSSVARRVSQPASAVRAKYTLGPRVVEEIAVDIATENCLAYVAGYLAHKVQQGHRCDACESALSSGKAVISAQREVLTALKSFTGVSDVDVGSLRLPTDDFYAVVRACYITTQAQAQTILHESGIARRLVACVCEADEAVRIQTRMCCAKILRDAVSRFVRLQLHVMSRKVVMGRGRGHPTYNRKLLKLTGC